MTNNYQMGAEIKAVTWLHNDINGNPLYEITFRPLMGTELHKGYTTNGISHQVSYLEDTICYINYHVTPKTKRIKITNIERCDK